MQNDDLPTRRGLYYFVEFLKLSVAAGATAAALLTYIYQQEATRAQQRSEYQRRLWEQQLVIQLEVVRVASVLSTTRDLKSTEYLTARSRFDQLYFGEMCVIVDEEVEPILFQFLLALNAYERDPKSEDGKRMTLLNRCQELAVACRHSTNKRLESNLGELRRPNPGDIAVDP